MNGCIYRNEFDVCKKYTTDKATSFCAGRNCRDRKPSNSDHIRSMTDEELADFLCKVACNTTPVGYYHIEGWLEWLKEESVDE